jgi:PAS domain S-box-containing protein
MTQPTTTESRAEIELQRLRERVADLERQLNNQHCHLAAAGNPCTPYRRFFSLSLDMLCVGGADGFIKNINPAFERALGYTAEELMERPAIEFIHPDDVERTLKAMAQLESGESLVDFENRYRCRDGSFRWLSWRTTAADDGTVFAVAHDVTERKEKEEQLRRSEELLRETERLAEVGGWEVDLETMIPLWSEEVFRIFGVRPDHQLSLDETIDFYSPEARSVISKALHEALEHGSSWDLELPGVTTTGQQLWVRTIGRVDFEGGKAVRLAGSLQDVTDRKKTEIQLRNTAADLVRSNTELERFAHAASHDLQEPLRTVAGFAELMALRHGERLDGEGKEFLDFIVTGAHRMQQLIEDLLHFSQVGANGITPSTVDCRHLVDEVLPLLDRSVTESDATITVGPLPEVHGDGTLLSRLFQNLVSNAIKFRSERPLEVAITAEPHGAYWQFQVRDNGIGIDPRFAERIFVVFRRLHDQDAYPGTGIGLAVCKKIVELHGGELWVESAEGDGATFFFTLPAERST